jgi:hypothetical protein
VYIAVGTALVSFPILRTSSGKDRDELVIDTLRTFGRLIVPASAVVVTVPTGLALLLLPAQYAQSLTLLPWLAITGIGLGATTVVATLLLALRNHFELALGLSLSAGALVVGLTVGAGGTAPGLARSVAIATLVSAFSLTLVGIRSRHGGIPLNLPSFISELARVSIYALLVGSALFIVRGSTILWFAAASVLALLVAVPITDKLKYRIQISRRGLLMLGRYSSVAAHRPSAHHVTERDMRAVDSSTGHDTARRTAVPHQPRLPQDVHSKSEKRG